jgi:hypothetical protein
VTWPPFAFLALSAAMLGGGLAGTVLAIRPSWAMRAGAPAAGALLVAIGSPLAVVSALSAGLEPLMVTRDIGAALVFTTVLLIMALPFAGLGVALSAMLEQTPGRPQLPYGADLCGGALGAFLSVPLIDALGVTATSGLAAILGAIAALLLGGRKPLALVASIVGAGVLVVGGSLLPNPTADKKVGTFPAGEVLRKLDENGRLLSADRADGRVDVIPAQPAPRFLIDLGAAVTRAPVYPVRGGPPTDAASAGFLAVSPAGKDVLIIGSGAGFEVARALAHGAGHIDAVEVSSGVVDLVRHDDVKSSQRVFADQRVALHLDEARSFLERSDKTWSHIVAVHTITNAALSVGAMRLAEDFLLTADAMTTLIGHLEPGGVLYMTRPESQLALLCDVAREGLKNNGVDGDLEQHLVVLEPDQPDPFFRGLLIFRSAAPDPVPAPPGIRLRPAPQTTGKPLPTDDRPFFHRSADEVEADQVRLRLEGPQLADHALTGVGLISTLAALVVLVLPLFARRREDHLKAPPLSLLAVAGLLGVAFMFAELALAQRLTLLLGRPLVAFAVVVGGMLLGAGGGALALGSRPFAGRLVATLALCAASTSLAVFVPGGIEAVGALGWPGGVRVALGVGLSVLIALPLGLPFPALIEQSRARGADGAAPWLYALNAVTAVGAGALHAALAPLVGLSGTTLFAGIGYGLALILAILSRQPPSSSR